MTKASKFANVTVHEPPTQDEKEAWYKGTSRRLYAVQISVNGSFVGLAGFVGVSWHEALVGEAEANRHGDTCRIVCKW